MKTGLFIPCYIDQFYPKVAIATLELLEKLGIEVAYPLNQTCCGQPMANAGYANYGKNTEHLFVENFQDFDYIVTPSGSCALHVKDHFGHLEQTTAVKKVRSSVFELVEFLTDVVKVEQLNASFPYKVGYHASCHGLRGLHLGSASELRIPPFSKAHQLLNMVKDIELVELDRSDECCGFGGTFAVSEEAISVKMGKDRITDHRKHDAEVITGGDMSCLMHLEGLLKRQEIPIKVMHIAEILNH
jgi:L-lactate dehydrogenase complex protein LldE